MDDLRALATRANVEITPGVLSAAARAKTMLAPGYLPACLFGEWAIHPDTFLDALNPHWISVFQETKLARYEKGQVTIRVHEGVFLVRPDMFLPLLCFFDRGITPRKA